MVTIDLITGEPWVPGTEWVREMYNLGRYVDETKAEWVPATSSQGEREAEFNRWRAEEIRALAERFVSFGDSKDALLAYAERVALGGEQ